MSVSASRVLQSWIQQPASLTFLIQRSLHKRSHLLWPWCVPPCVPADSQHAPPCSWDSWTTRKVPVLGLYAIPSNWLSPPFAPIKVLLGDSSSSFDPILPMLRWLQGSREIFCKL